LRQPPNPEIGLPERCRSNFND